MESKPVVTIAARFAFREQNRVSCYLIIRPNKLNIQFLLPRPCPLTAGCVPYVYVQLNYVAVAFWMYILSVAMPDYIATN